MKFAANLSMLFTEAPFLNRFDAAAQAGFAGVEFLFPYEWPAREVAARAADAQVEIVLFNLPPGDFAAGERGLAALRGREDEFRRSLDVALRYAEFLKVRRLHAMAGLDVHGACVRVYRDNLAYAAQRLEREEITLLIEPINRRDMPGYFLSRQDDARETIACVQAANLKLQCDIYHLQIAGGDIIRTLERDIALIGHVQIAGVPDRHEPDSGEVAYPAVLAALDQLGYDGWVGCEYRPRATTQAGLGWIARYRPHG
jgi:2-dehydrotetronate isomerase